MILLIIALMTFSAVIGYNVGYGKGYRATGEVWRNDIKGRYQESIKSWKGEI